MITGKGLRAKQRKFIEYYDGEPIKTAIAAGYKSPKRAANGLLKNNLVLKKLREREAREPNPLVADRIERQIFLTKIMRDDNEPTHNRIKAAVQLSKMNGDYIVKHEDVNNFDKLKLQAIRFAVMEFLMNNDASALEQVENVIDICIHE
jgi:phage terminase small subunit